MFTRGRVDTVLSKGEPNYKFLHLTLMAHKRVRGPSSGGVEKTRTMQRVSNNCRKRSLDLRRNKKRYETFISAAKDRMNGVLQGSERDPVGEVRRKTPKKTASQRERLSEDF